MLFSGEKRTEDGLYSLVDDMLVVVGTLLASNFWTEDI